MVKQPTSGTKNHRKIVIFTIFHPWIMVLPSGELTFCHGKSPCLMRKSTISMAIFHCYVSSPEGNEKIIFEWWILLCQMWLPEGKLISRGEKGILKAGKSMKIVVPFWKATTWGPSWNKPTEMSHCWLHIPWYLINICIKSLVKLAAMSTG